MQEHEEVRRDREEEHRLAYVAMTRAKERLYLTTLRQEFNIATRRIALAMPSRFLQRLEQLDDSICTVRASHLTSNVLQYCFATVANQLLSWMALYGGAGGRGC